MLVSVDADWVRAGRLSGLVLLVAALCVPTSGCAKKAGSASMSPEAQRERGGEQADTDGSGDPLAELDALEDRMRAFGLATASRAKASANDDAIANDGDAEAEAGGAEFDAGADRAVRDEVSPAPTAASESTSPSIAEEATSRCGDLCDLSESICMLEVRICSLSDSHSSEPIYADACERAVDDCHTAGQACDTCDT